MTDKEKIILKILEKVIPCLSELEKERLLGFGEGIAFKIDELEKSKRQNKPEPATAV